MALAALLSLVYPARYLGYDQSWALIWGREVASGQSPEYQATYAPTPHPLPNAVGALASLAGSPADGLVLLGVTAIAFGALVLLVARVGAVLYAWPVGVIAAVLVATRPLLVLELGNASTDVWFLAIFAAALLCHARDPRRPLRVLAWLALAGLVRPEAWFLSSAYLLYAFGRRAPREWLVGLAIALVGPAIWVASDALVTADPFYSLHGTRALAEALDRPRSGLAAVAAVPQSLRHLLGNLLVGLGLVGAVVATLAFYARSLVALGAAAVGLLTFLGLGLLGLPVLDRYLLGPAVILTLFGGLVLGGWATVAAGSRRRASWTLGSLSLAAVIVALDTPSNLRALHQTAAFTRAREDVQSSLASLLESRRISRAVSRCGIAAPDQASLAVIVVRLGLPPRSARRGALAADAEGVQLAYASAEARDVFAIGPASPLASSRPAPARVRLAATRYWVIDARCSDP